MNSKSKSVPKSRYRHRPHLAIQIVDQRGGMADVSHCLALRIARLTQPRDNRNPRAMKAEIVQTYLAEKHMPRRSRRCRRLRYQHLALLSPGPLYQRQQILVQRCRMHTPALHLECDRIWIRFRVDPLERHLHLPEPTSLLHRDQKTLDHPWLFQFGKNESLLVASNGPLLLRIPPRHAQPRTRISNHEPAPQRLLHDHGQKPQFSGHGIPLHRFTVLPARCPPSHVVMTQSIADFPRMQHPTNPKIGTQTSPRSLVPATSALISIGILDPFWNPAIEHRRNTVTGITTLLLSFLRHHLVNEADATGSINSHPARTARPRTIRSLHPQLEKRRSVPSKIAGHKGECDTVLHALSTHIIIYPGLSTIILVRPFGIFRNAVFKHFLPIDFQRVTHECYKPCYMNLLNAAYRGILNPSPTLTQAA